MRKSNVIKTSEYHIYHAKTPFLWRSLKYRCHQVSMDVIEKAFRNGKYRHVHTLTLPSDDLEFQLEECFRLTNDVSWNKAKPCRSTSVGDIVKVGDNVFIVAGRGFDLIPGCSTEIVNKTGPQVRSIRRPANPPKLRD